MQITETKFDSIERAIKNCTYDLQGWFPSVDDLDKYVYPNKSKFMVFVLFLLEKSKGMSLSREGKAVQKELQEFVYQELEIGDGVT